MSDIKAILEKYGLDIEKATWRVHGTTVLYHWAIERIAEKAGIKFDMPVIVRAERDEAVVIVAGHMATKTEWACGEAVIGVNYQISGRQAPFVYAMAEKRAKDRVVLKLVELHGDAYAEDEPDQHEKPQQRAPEKVDVEKIKTAIMDWVDQAKTAEEIETLMKSLSVREAMAKTSPEDQQKLRLYAQTRWHSFKALTKVRDQNGKGLEDASDRRKEDVSTKLRMGKDASGGFGNDKTPDDLLADFKEELRYCHTRDEVQAIVESYREAVEALIPPDQAIANDIRTERLNQIAKGP